MPFLKFGRDRRGYESTFLLHAARSSRTGEPSLLYWFRSPPHIKIGRAAFDEDAIRLLEQQHPDVEFDWDRILTARAPAAPEPRDPREGRPRGKPERRPAREGRRDRPLPPRPAPAEAVRPEAASLPEIHESPEIESPEDEPAVLESPELVEAAARAAETTSAPSLPPLPALEAVADLPAPAQPDSAPARRFVRVFDQQSLPHHATELAAVERRLGAEQLTLLRARYAEIRARITARGGDPARVEALREQAERVNPDSWVTDADVEAGLATVEATLAELHRIVGRRRRRRRRRGAGPGPGGEAPQTTPIPEPSDEGGDDGDDAGPDDDEGAL